MATTSPPSRPATSSAWSSGASVVGVDVADRMLRVAGRLAPGTLLARMDLERLGLRDGAFDAAVCGHGYQFVPELGRALAETRRILRPGGRLAASVPAEIRS